jgi:DNA polymerase III subunit epsilon
MKWFWQKSAAASVAAEANRWVVLDIETTGLQAKSDDILSIAAIGIRVDWPNRKLSIDLNDTFETLIKPDGAVGVLNAQQRSNVLLHGIGVESRGQGHDTKSSLLDLQAYLQSAPLLAFHAEFDRSFLARAHKRNGLLPLTNDWLDIAEICAVAYPKRRAHTLDEWMQTLGVDCLARHRAAADALAECELLLRAWPMLSRQCEKWGDLQLLTAQRQWGRG